jgi:hypothetical protein
MAIHRLIAVGTFGPDEIKAMTAAYEGALTDLGFADREDPLTELIAKSIVNVTATGERDPERIKERALNALGKRRGSEITFSELLHSPPCCGVCVTDAAASRAPDGMF